MRKTGADRYADPAALEILAKHVLGTDGLYCAVCDPPASFPCGPLWRVQNGVDLDDEPLPAEVAGPPDAYRMKFRWQAVNNLEHEAEHEPDPAKRAALLAKARELRVAAAEDSQRIPPPVDLPATDTPKHTRGTQ